MSRPLKFRIWNNVEKKWELGYDYGNLGGFSMIGETMLFGEYERLLNSVSISELNRFEITQFTGIQDNKGKDIYEGDILKNGDINDPEQKDAQICEVIFDNTCFTTVTLPRTAKQRWITFHDWKVLEVIGNIFENPEMLEA